MVMSSRTLCTNVDVYVGRPVTCRSEVYICSSPATAVQGFYGIIPVSNKMTDVNDDSI